MVFYLLSGQGLALLPPAILEYLSTGDELRLLTLGPICLLPQHGKLLTFESSAHFNHMRSESLWININRGCGYSVIFFSLLCLIT